VVAVARQGKRNRWILLAAGLILLVVSVIYVVLAILGGWSLPRFLNVLWSLASGLFWVLLYRRSAKPPSPSEESQPGPN
jgi:hypothetical protein